MRVRFGTINDISKPRIYSVRNTEELKWFSTFKDLKKTGRYNEVTYLNCSNMKLKSLPKLPKYLEELDCGRNYIKKLPKLPKTLKKLDIYNNKIKKLPKLSDDVEITGFYGGQYLPDYSGYSYSAVGTFTSAASQNRRHVYSNIRSHMQDPMLYGSCSYGGGGGCGDCGD